MECRSGCGACCIAPSISSAIPGMPQGKPAGIRCIQLTQDNRCQIFEQATRPKVCLGIQASLEMCGDTFEYAMQMLKHLEEQTKP